MLRALIVTALIAAALLTISCVGPRGTYRNSDGAVTLELKPGGEGTFAFLGEANPCTYTINGNKLKLNFKIGGEIVFLINADGSLTGLPENKFGPLRKAKS